MDKVDEPDLLRRSREGDKDAFDELFRHHYPSAVRYAARITSSLDPEDLTAEAFARIWATISGGGGPDYAFGKYLRTTIKNLAVNTATRSSEEPAEDDRLDYWLRRDAQVADDGFSAMLAEHEAVAEAFETLPQRWRSVLWMIDVEGRRTADVAVRLGLTANSAAALTKRARAALSQAWLTTQLEARGTDPECAWVHDHLSGFARGTLTTAQRERVRRHLDECDDCDRAAHRVAHLATSLRIVALIAGGSIAGLATFYATEPAQAAGPHGIEGHVAPHGAETLTAGGTAAGAVPVDISAGGAAGKSAGKAASSGSQAGIVAAVAAVAVVAVTVVIANTLNSPNVRAEQPRAGASAKTTQSGPTLAITSSPKPPTPSSTPEPPERSEEPEPPEEPATLPTRHTSAPTTTASRTTTPRPTQTTAKPTRPSTTSPTRPTPTPAPTSTSTSPTHPPLTSPTTDPSPTQTTLEPTGTPSTEPTTPAPTNTTPTPEPTPTSTTPTPEPTPTPTTTPTPKPTPTTTAPSPEPTSTSTTPRPTPTWTWSPWPTPTWTWTPHPWPTPTWTHPTPAPTASVEPTEPTATR
ncbi:MAG: sigma-70 family RNA polymerase sigma factor [Tessaracoccus sp.]|uniref:sigma-70 family RNA polymerase sigma factor n=1 Tax=Tessaracoccus sp. TaxID=1971211 RepID=UPI001EB892C0|nr:sigma-70 family RNA polymerase sigma factor [Tessaracoccus sp.]MBK7822082.1 sigma-70 family RNA polymerase sigma factor [Tessaracoccus sp.]